MDKPLIDGEPLVAEKTISSIPDLAVLLQANLEMTKEIRAMVRHINTYVAWQRLFGWIKFLLILIPLIIGAIYLPPLLKDYYQQLLQAASLNLSF
jgi:hypothetical protein